MQKIVMHRIGSVTIIYIYIYIILYGRITYNPCRMTRCACTGTEQCKKTSKTM